MASDKDIRYCHCGNVEIRDGIGSTSSGSEVTVRYTFLTELRKTNGSVLYCICCGTNVARVEGVQSLADLDKASVVAIMDAIDEEELRAQQTYSDVFGVVLPKTDDADEDVNTSVPPQIQDTFEAAVDQKRDTIQALINDFTATKKQEFKSWREEARKQAKLLASVASSPVKKLPSHSLSPTPAVRISSPSQPKPSPQNSELFQKSPVSQYSHPGASPLAAASLTHSFQERPVIPPSPPAKQKTPPIPLSSSLKSPVSSNYSKPVKRVMFQDPPDEAQTDVDEDLFEEESEEPDIPSLSNSDATISVDDELFDFDETIPSIAVESDTAPSSLSPNPTQPVRSPLFAPPLSPFRRRTVEKYDLPGGDDEDPFEEIPVTPNGVPIITDELSSSKPIAITPPSRSFLSEGLGADDEDEVGGMKELIERISLKNTRSGKKSSFADQTLLWDIPGDFYRSVRS